MNDKQVPARMIKALFNDQRLKILAALLKARPEGMTVEEISCQLGVSRRIASSTVTLFDELGIVELIHVVNPGHGRKLLAIASDNIIIRFG